MIRLLHENGLARPPPFLILKELPRDGKAEAIARKLKAVYRIEPTTGDPKPVTAARDNLIQPVDGQRVFPAPY